MTEFRTFGNDNNAKDFLKEMLAEGSPILDLLRDAVTSELQGDATEPRDVQDLLLRMEAQIPQGTTVDFGAEQHSWSQVAAELKTLAEATPRTTGPRFFNQLFAGMEPAALAGELLSTILNTSMYTFKVGGPHVFLEKAVTARMAAKCGFDPALSEGTLCPGGSIANLSALIVARGELFPNVASEGLAGGPVCTIYSSTEAHYSISKSVMVLGVGRKNLRCIPVDDKGCMIPSELAKALDEDIAAGKKPIAVVATCGTTVLGAFDPVNAIADVCAERNVWMHVDAAMGGTLLLSPDHADKLAGIERAQSVTWCLHKLMGVPIVCSAALFPKKGLLSKHMNEQSSSYLFQVAKDDKLDVNPGRSSIQCGRRNDALKVWAAWRHIGDDGYAKRVNRQMELANRAADIVDKDPRCKLLLRPQAITISWETPNVSAVELCDMMDAEHCFKVGHAVALGKVIVRMSVCNSDTTDEEMDVFFDTMFKTMDKLAAKE